MLINWIGSIFVSWLSNLNVSSIKFINSLKEVEGESCFEIDQISSFTDATGSEVKVEVMEEEAVSISYNDYDEGLIKLEKDSSDEEVDNDEEGLKLVEL